MLSKRGQGLSTNAIVLMVLGVIILVVLVVGFTVGFEKIAPWLSSNNVDTIVTSCSVACSTNNIYEFCSLERTLKADDLPSGGKEVMGTCNDLANEEVNSEYAKYGIQECPALVDECPEAETLPSE
jgi:hypothetical protein